VSALARRVGVGADTVRYYERVGLLAPPERTPADYRIYDESAVDRLQFIQGAQRLGLRLREIKTLLEVRDTGRCPCEPAEQLLRNHIAEIDRELASAEPRLSGSDAGDMVAKDEQREEVIIDECTEMDLPVLRGPAV
jgi:DNA-binding transcriptional MerR regulator